MFSSLRIPTHLAFEVNMHGQFLWYELHTPDAAASIKFYPKITGWGTQPFDNDYTMWTTGGQPFAGLYKLSDEMRAQGVPPNWMTYVEVDNVDKSAALATSLGATIMHGPADIPHVGRFAVMQDPDGAVIGLYKSATGARAWDGTNIIDRFSWHELMTRDHTKAFALYSKLFGWEKVGEMDMGGGLMYLMFGKGDKMYGGMFSMGPEWVGMHPFWLLYIHVKDVPKAVAAATKAGATLHRGPMDIPGGVIAILGDPQGAAFAVHALTPVVAAAKPASKKTVTTTAKKKRAANKPASKKVTRNTAATKSTAKKKTLKKPGKKNAAKKPAKKKSAKKASVKRRMKHAAPKKRGAKRLARKSAKRR